MVNLGIRQHVHPRFRGAQQRMSQRGGDALLVERGNQGFADTQLGDDLSHVIEFRKRVVFSSQLNGFAVFSGKGPQGVLYLEAQLPQHRIRHVGRVLSHEEDANPFGTDELHHRLDLAEQGLGRFFKYQVGLIDKDDELGLIHIAHFGESGVDLCQDLQHKRGEQLGAVLDIRQADD